MPTLESANMARMNAALDRKYRFAHGVDTFRAMIARGVFSHADSAEVPRVTYNRRKFNAMDHRQQMEYERKMRETKTEYRLHHAIGIGYVACPKMVFDYFCSLSLEQKT